MGQGFSAIFLMTLTLAMFPDHGLHSRRVLPPEMVLLTRQ